MISTDELASTARARLIDAEVLRAARRFDSAIYLCGYAVEIQLKAAICRTIGWAGFPSSSREFENLRSFKTHDLALLLHLTDRGGGGPEPIPERVGGGGDMETGIAVQSPWISRRVEGAQDARCCHDNRRIPVDPFVFRLVSFEDHLEREHGKTCLFALVRRLAFLSRWDVYFSAQWLGNAPHGASEYIRDKLVGWLELEDLDRLGITPALLPCDPFVSSIIERVRGHEILHELDEAVFDEVKYDRIIVINACSVG